MTIFAFITDNRIRRRSQYDNHHHNNSMLVSIRHAFMWKLFE